MRKLFHFVFALAFLLAINSVYATNLKTFENELADSIITTKITTKYTENKNLNPLKIAVSTHNGTVTLTGHVKDKAALLDALQLAKSTRGVKTVNAENLDIKRVNTPITDAYITTKVEGAILKAKILDDESIPLVGINAQTSNGIVTLSGNVKRHESITPIIQRVLAVKGVKKVVSHLQVIQQES